MSTFRMIPGNAGAGLPMGSIIPRRLVDDPRLVVSHDPGSPLAERYRRLRLRLEQGATDASLPQCVTLITSAVPGEGKTTTSINLALAYAENRKRPTLLIDGDLRRPSVSGYIRPEPSLGLSEVLRGEVPLDHALIELSDSKLWVLPAGAPTATPLGLLQSEHLGRLIAELRGRFHRIVIDSPPTVPFTDAAVLASHADGALLVVRAGTTTKPLIRRAVESLSGNDILGIVLNDVEFTIVDRYYNRYDDYQPDRYAYARENGKGTT